MHNQGALKKKTFDEGKARGGTKKIKFRRTAKHKEGPLPGPATKEKGEKKKKKFTRQYQMRGHRREKKKILVLHRNRTKGRGPAISIRRGELPIKSTTAGMGGKRKKTNTSDASKLKN